MERLLSRDSLAAEFWAVSFKTCWNGNSPRMQGYLQAYHFDRMLIFELVNELLDAQNS